MPKLKDFNPTQKKFMRVEYTPWDDSPPAKEIIEEEVIQLGSKQVQNDTKIGSNEVHGGLSASSKQVQNDNKIGSNTIQKEVDRLSKIGLNQVHKIKDSCVSSSAVNSDDIYGLTGAQKKILFLMVEICCAKGVLKTPPINNTALANKLEIPKETAKTAIRRLVEKGIISKSKSKQGIGGFCCFEITEEIKYFVLEVQKSSIHTGFMEPTTRFELGSDLGSTSIVSSSYINNNTTNTSDEFSSIDCSPLTEIAFTEAHLIQIRREYEKKSHLALAPSIIQDSINALAFDLKHNKVADDFKSSPAVVLTALLKKGIPYSSKTPEKFKTPQQEAMDAYLAMKEQQHKLTKEAERRAFELEFESWQSSLAEEELLELCPPEEVPVKEGDMFYKAARRKIAKERARDYFEAEIWPAKKQEILNMG